MSKPLVTRVGDRIVRIRFEVTCDKPFHQYLSILNDMPDDKAKREWIAGVTEMVVGLDGWAEVTPQ
jgi:hypothetical protein